VRNRQEHKEHCSA